jgi:hypothetical protein
MAIRCRNYGDSVTEFNDNIVQELKFWYFHAESIKFRCVTPFYRKFHTFAKFLQVKGKLPSTKANIMFFNVSNFF